MDKSAQSHEYIMKVENHASQVDHKQGFGGKFGVQKDRQDKSAAGWDHIEKVEKHDSQKGWARELCCLSIFYQKTIVFFSVWH